MTDDLESRIDESYHKALERAFGMNADGGYNASNKEIAELLNSAVKWWTAKREGKTPVFGEKLAARNGDD